MDPYGIEKAGIGILILQGKIVIQVKRKNKRLIDSEQRTKNKEQRTKTKER
jgi:hypothetical protein